ncbi:hypothetical protein ZOSMA_6G01850 [Zostera marina]|uniref:Nuclear pore complex protein NUP205 n=1 Tax=Zostera marina TaxID=29655 RepID=A0A0K9NTH9_ZOSMR|nr:hypothetical protein ZOSMA_6G01850 [Zostera marina]
MDGRSLDSTNSAKRRTVFSSKSLLSIIESALLSPTPTSPSQRIELMYAIRSALPAFKSLLCYPVPKASDRAQIQSKEVRLADSTLISLDDFDVQIASKLSDDLNLNEIDCVHLLVATNQEWVLFGRDPLEIFRLAVGLWYTERRNLITSLYTLFRAVLLDQGLEDDLVADIQKLLEDLLNSGLRQKLISLIKELNREEPAGLGGPNSEAYMLDSKGVLVERKAVIHRERLSLGHCLVFSVLIVRTSSMDVKDIFSVLKDCAVVVNNNDTVKLQITLSLLFSLLITFMSDALSTVPDKVPILSHDVSFKREFHVLVLTAGNNAYMEGFIDSVRLGWFVHLMLTQEERIGGDMANANNCLELICSHNVFNFLLVEVFLSTAYQNDDEDMTCMYNAYMHKLMMCFISHPLVRDKVKRMKEKSMSTLSPYRMSISDSFGDKAGAKPQELSGPSHHPFISLLDLIAQIYKKEPDLLFDNDDLWTFVNFAGEDHTNIQTLVAFLGLLSTLASSEEGASKVFELLQGKTFRSIGWNTLFDCLSIYEQKFKESLQNAGAMLPHFQEGDAKALVAYLNVLQKVVENGNPTVRKNWFPDIEPLFKLLSYENVPPYLKGALRDAIASFVQVSPLMKDTIWRYLEQYDLPVVVGPPAGNSMQKMPTQIYDMRFELNEVEAREERYPSTISFLNLLNTLIAKETDTSDRGHRFVGIFRFIYDHIFDSFTQRAYVDPCEKWKLAIACLQHFQMILSMYNVKDEDIETVHPPQPPVYNRVPLEQQLPILELFKDFMSGRTVFRNIMGILLLGVNTVIHDRTSQTYGHFLEKAVHLSLEIIILVLQKDLFLSDFWSPLYKSLDVILSQDHKQLVTLLEYVRYNFDSQVQQCAIKIMAVLSSRVVGLVQLLLKSGTAKYLIEDYAACLESRLEESGTLENTKDDTGVLIMQLLIDNISRPEPNIAHLLLTFDMDTPVERSVLQPKYYYSCFKVILDNLDTLSKPDSNALIYEFSFQLLYELCSDPLTGGPTMELLNSKRYQFFLKHLNSVALAPLPKRSTNQALRISSLHQRAWLLKLLAFELHVADMSASTHRDTCLAILSKIFFRGNESQTVLNAPDIQRDPYTAGVLSIDKVKVLELLEIVQFKAPDTNMNYSQIMSNLKNDLRVGDIFSPSETENMCYYSERGDRLIDLAVFHDKLWQYLQSCSISIQNDVDVNTSKESIQQLVRMGWKYNKNLEEQASQLHMLVGWSQIVEITISKRMLFLEDRSQILFELLDSSLSASVSPDCSLKMALILSQVALTCMAKLRDERFLCLGSVDSDNITCLNLIMVKQLPNGACHSILLKIVMTILRNDSSELLRRRHYSLLLCYFQYCSSILNPNVPESILQFLLCDEEDGDNGNDLQRINREQADLTHANFSILKKEVQAILTVVTKDSLQGSESGKAMALYVLDAFISIDQDRFFLSQLQSRGFLRECLMDISNFSYQDSRHSLDSLQRLCTMEAKLALLLRISHQCKKLGSDVLLSMGVLEHLSSSQFVGWHIKSITRSNYKVSKDQAVKIDKQQLLLTPVLRLVLSLISMVDLTHFFEVKNKVVREVIDFVKAQQSTIDQILTVDISDADEVTYEQINLVVSILSKVWPYDENDECGFVQELFRMMTYFFSLKDLSSTSIHFSDRKMELTMFQIIFSLSSYLYFLVTKKSLRLQISDTLDDFGRPGIQPQPTLLLVVSILTSTTNTLERTSEEKSLLLSKIQDINELSRQEVDEIICACMKQDCILAFDNIGKRRYVAMVEMCHIAGDKEQLLTLSLHLSEHALNILMTHLQENMVKFGNVDDCSSMCTKLLSTLEKLEQLKEDKVGRNLKVFFRSVSMLKELTIRNMAL